MTANFLQFQENGLKIWITIPPKVEHDGNGKAIEASETKVVSLDNLYAASSDHQQARSVATGGDSLASTKLPFVWKLYEMLEDVASSKQEHIVSWVRNGKAFKVHHLEKFVDEIIPKYCKLSKFKSFQRQMYFYGFNRIPKGSDAGAYHHPKFVRGMKTMCLTMSPKNSRRRRRSNSTAKSCTKQAAQLVAMEERSTSPCSLSTTSQDDGEDYSGPIPLNRKITSILVPGIVPGGHDDDDDKEEEDRETCARREPNSMDAPNGNVEDRWIIRELQDLLINNGNQGQQEGGSSNRIEFVFDGMPFHSL